MNGFGESTSKLVIKKVYWEYFGPGDNIKSQGYTKLII